MIALKEIGVVNYNDRRVGINHDLLKSVQALNGLADSIQLLHRLTQFVIHSLHLDQQMTPKTLAGVSDKLLNHLSANSQAIFQSTVRLFPPGFPLDSPSSSVDFDGLADLVDGLNSRLEQLDAKMGNLQRIAGDVYRENVDHIKYASEKDIDSLRAAMFDLKHNVMRFNKELAEENSSKTNAAKRTEVMTALGQGVSQAKQ